MYQIIGIYFPLRIDIENCVLIFYVNFGFLIIQEIWLY